MANIPRGHRMSPLNHEPEAVVYAREKAGLTQAEAVKAIGVIKSAGYLSEIESGTRNATPKVLQAMARAYNCPVVVLERKRWTAA